MKEDKLRQTIQVIVAKLALGIKLTDSEKSVRLFDRAKKSVNRSRLEAKTNQGIVVNG